MVVSGLTASAVRGAMGAASSMSAGSAQAQPTALQNRAASSKSPFVRSSEKSLVKWQILDAVTVERAKRENKLIFLHIGYKACHLCRVMAQDTFLNPECAAVLNESFVPVIVDRDQRADIDNIYMNYVSALSQIGGWPLNCFVTPDMAPVFGGTFWPGPGTRGRSSRDKHDEMPDSLVIFKRMRDIWREQEARCLKEASEVLEQLREFAADGTLGSRELRGSHPIAKPSWVPPSHLPPTTTHVANSSRSAPASTELLDLDLDQLEEAYTSIAGTYDPVHGGFGVAPKFLIAPRLAFLLQLNAAPSAVQDVVGEAECRHASQMAVETLRRIRDGALHDHIGATGFARCSVTRDWSVPNFEKLVVDNALLLTLFLNAWHLAGETSESEFLDNVLEIGDYLSSPPISLPEGALATSEAADSLMRRGDKHTKQGAYYLWTRREFDSVLHASVENKDKQISQVAAAYWDVREGGNVDEALDPNDDLIKQNILRVIKTPQELAQQFGLAIDTVHQYIQTARRALRERRQKERDRPELDDKVITAWNGLAMSSLAQASVALSKVAPAKSEKYLRTAESIAGFITTRLWDADAKILYRIWRDGADTPGFADDYAHLINGLLDLFTATGDESYIRFADVLQKTQIALFWDADAGAFFSTTAIPSSTSSSAHIILRLKDGMDTSVPSVNAASAANLFRLGRLLDDERYSALARATIAAFEVEMLQHPWLFPGLLGAVVTARLGFTGPLANVEYKNHREKA